MTILTLLPRPVAPPVPTNVYGHPALTIDQIRAIGSHNRLGIRIRALRGGGQVVVFTRPAGHDQELDVDAEVAHRLGVPADDDGRAS